MATDFPDWQSFIFVPSPFYFKTCLQSKYVVLLLFYLFLIFLRESAAIQVMPEFTTRISLLPRLRHEECSVAGPLYFASCFCLVSHVTLNLVKSHI